MITLTELEQPGSCTRCGVWEQQWRNSAGECSDCHNTGYREYREARRAQLAAMPRCEVDACKRRATWTVGGGVGLCGRHLKAARRRLASCGVLALTVTDPRDILSMAQR